MEEKRRTNEKKKPRRRIGRFRAFIGNLLILLTVNAAVFITADMLYRISAVAAKDSYRTVLIYIEIICAVTVLLAIDVRTGSLTAIRALPAKILGIAVRTVLILAALAVLGICGVTAAAGLVNTAGEADTVILLGMALENGMPNSDMLRRIDTAADYAIEHPDCTVIATGGNSGEGDMTEAEIMKLMLMEKGVGPERIVTEEQAADTKENFANAAKLTDPSEPVVIVSSSYHMRRAARLAKEAGFGYVMRLPSPADPTTYCTNLLWETVMEFNHIVFGQ